MAVPSSGALSLLGIMREVKNNAYSASFGVQYFGISLHSLSTGGQGTINTANASTDRPDGNEPHMMSEFYNYDHDKVSTTSFQANGGPNNSKVCGNSPNTTFYHDGSGTSPAVGDKIFTNSAGTSFAGAGFLALSTAAGIQINSSSTVIAFYTCSPKKRG